MGIGLYHSNKRSVLVLHPLDSQQSFEPYLGLSKAIMKETYLEHSKGMWTEIIFAIITGLWDDIASRVRVFADN